LNTPHPSLEQYTELAQMAGGFIHDIKNHLGTLSLNLQLLAEDFEDAETHRERRARDRITRLSDECSKLVGISNDFLRFARAEELQREPVALEHIIERVIDFVAPTAKQSGVDINWLPASGLPSVSLDREMFEQALLNLVLNAEQAMPEGGTLSLIGRCEPGFVCLDVIDTGCGMSPEQMEKLFRPFHTTKKNGTGLGLPTARKTILAHGGAIELQSEPNRGTKVTIRLPALPE
jgi:signal transduction histidine kinase